MEQVEAPLRRFRLVSVVLPKAGTLEQELVPTLVDERTGLPPRLAMRWVMRSRRNAVGEKTLADDLRSASLLYAFCEDELKVSLDDFFAEGHRLSAAELDQLLSYLRSGRGSKGIRALTTTGQLISNAERFLLWLAKPIDRGGRTFVSPTDLLLYQEQLRLSFADLRSFRSRGNRIQPLSSDEDVELSSLISPLRRKDGRYDVPLRFSDGNPWHPSTRLRNWIAYLLSRELGLRRGEVGKVCVADVRNVQGPCLAVRRRPHDPSDTRTSTNRPKVKSLERELPISNLLGSAIRQYCNTLLKDGGRRGARTPYLLVTSSGDAISGTSLDAIWNAVNGQLRLDMSWHSLRHTWAEETADALLEQYQKMADASEIVLGILRELGGWSATSTTPLTYIRNALKKRGNAYLRKRNAKFDEGNRHA